jgi:hypothetical protein
VYAYPTFSDDFVAKSIHVIAIRDLSRFSACFKPMSGL